MGIPHRLFKTQTEHVQEAYTLLARLKFSTDGWGLRRYFITESRPFMTKLPSLVTK